MNLEEDTLFATAEADARNSARADRSRRRVQDLLKDRTKKKNRLLKKGRQEFDPWLEESALAVLREQLVDMDTSHHRKSQHDSVYHNSRRALKPIAVKALMPSVIIDAWIPFVDEDDYKRRPAVVISADRWNVDVYPLTSSLKHKRVKMPIHILENWAESGLTRPTGMQQRKVTVPRTDVLGVSGELIGVDRERFFQWKNSGSQTAAAVTMHIAQAVRRSAA